MSESTPTLSSSSAPAIRSRGGAVFAGAIGNIVEWYDFGTYGLFAVAIAANFFPSKNLTVGLLSTYALFAVSFFIRPLGSFVFGYLGDRYGRKNLLMVTVAIMGASTVAMGLTPSYSAIGALAPVLLIIFRLTQAFSAGGEWSGSSVYTVEFATNRRHNLYGSWVQVSASAGTLLASLTGALVGVLSTPDALTSWVWRIPFIVGGVIGVIALIVRRRMSDTPEFVKAADRAKIKHNPLGTFFRDYWRQGLIAVGITIGYTISIYMFSTYLPTYIDTTTHVQLTAALLGNSLQLIVLMILIPFAALLADRIGSRIVLIAFGALMFVCAVPLFMLISVGTVGTVILGQVLFAVIVSLIGGSAVATTTRLFPVEVRYSGLGVSYNIAVAAFGGTAPYISTWLIGTTGVTLSPAYYAMFAGLVVGFVAIFALRGSVAGKPSTD